jgi:hypothetical protein
MRHAKESELKEVYSHFHRRRDIFPHIRQDYVKRMVLAGQCVYQDGVIITYQSYKKATRVGSVLIPKGSIMLHQILNSGQFNGAAGTVFEQFCNEVVNPSDGDLYLAVRENNTVARGFYERHGMILVGTVVWDGGKMPGCIYRRLSA